MKVGTWVGLDPGMSSHSAATSPNETSAGSADAVDLVKESNAKAKREKENSEIGGV